MGGGIAIWTLSLGGLLLNVVPPLGSPKWVAAVLVTMLIGCCVGFLVGDHIKTRALRAQVVRPVPKENLIPGASKKSVAQSRELELTWAAVGYTVIFGLLVTLVGGLLLFVIPDWRPLLIADAGMLFVVIALWYGQNLEQR